MILFKPEHVAPILAGAKTQTRRLGRRRWREGSVHGCYTRPPFARGGAEPFCKVRILKVRRESLSRITTADAHAEGYQDTLAFMVAFYRINPKVDPHADLDVWVVTFELVEVG
jgi:hypothetical protein